MDLPATRKIDEIIDFFHLTLDRSIPIVAGKNYSFEHSIRVYVNKPQVVNNWLAGSITLQDSPSIDELTRHVAAAFDFYAYFSHVEIREFLSKSSKIFDDIRYLVAYNPTTILFYPIDVELGKKYPSPSFVHIIGYDERGLNLYIEEKPRGDGNNNKEFNNEAFSRQRKWLGHELLPKVNNWSLSIRPDPEFTCAHLNTLRLYDDMINDYWKLYQTMKTTYWSRFAPVWPQLTGTDPEKFIYEDIHIACYLILAWKHFKCDVKCFVDLGCGNGLLVYILNNQGFNGYGIDMRERKIWSNEHFKAQNTKLIESTINPSDDTFESCDWLIGNHSDELSPWLPIMAYKSRCNFFLIPCCMFDFYAKFESKLANKSRSESYLEYLHKISEKFEFETYRDKLRIPSTKNACFIGVAKQQQEESRINVDELVKERIEELTGRSNTSLEFKARDLTLEQARSLRNCTKNVPNDLKEFIVRTVVNKLVENDEDKPNEFVKKYDSSEWNCGRTLTLNQVASLFDQDVMKKLKLECGGVKTLLRNHGRLFEVYDRDKVRLRRITALVINDLDEEKRKLLKTKWCPFDQYHPNGCLLDNENCYFLHLENKK